MSQLLPPNASQLELAIMDFIQAKLAALDIPIRRLWSPWLCPLELLPWLAWAVSVDEWDAQWSEQQKRETVASSFKIHRKKGTRAAVAQRLNALGYGITLTEWFEQPDLMLPFTFNVDIETNNKPIASTIFGTTKQLIDSAKNTRSHLTRLRINCDIESEFRVGSANYSGVLMALGGPLNVIPTPVILPPVVASNAIIIEPPAEHLHVLQFGRTLALSEDGNVLAVVAGYVPQGAARSSTTSTETRLYIYKRINGEFILNFHQILHVGLTNLNGNQSHCDVFISQTGNKIAVRVPRNNLVTGTGMVQIFVNTGPAWWETFTSIISHGGWAGTEFDQIGMAMSADGTMLSVSLCTILFGNEFWSVETHYIGGNINNNILNGNSALNNVPAVLEAQNSMRGFALSLSGSVDARTTLAIGMPVSNSTFTAGSVMTLDNITDVSPSPKNANPQTILCPLFDNPTNQNSLFGTAMRMNYAGTRMAIGSPRGVAGAGGRAIFDRVGDNWVPVLIDALAADEIQGSSIGMDYSGNVIAFNSSPRATRQKGFVDVLFNAGNHVVRKQEDSRPDEAGLDYGAGCAVSGDGNWLAVGEPGRNATAGGPGGRVYIYSLAADKLAAGI